MLVVVRQMNSDISAVGVYTDAPVYHTRGTQILRISDASGATADQLALAADGMSVIWQVRDGKLIGMGRLMRTSLSGYTGIAYMEIALPDWSSLQATIWEGSEGSGLAILQKDTIVGMSGSSLQDGSWLLDTDEIEEHDGARYFIVRRDIGAHDLSLIYYCPYAQLHMDMSGLILMILVAVVVSVLVLIGISILMSGSITKRIDELNRSMERVEAGSTDVRTTVDGSDEIADLSRHFDRMVESLDHYIQTNYKNELDLKDAQLRMLQSQIDPHFLYNTLSMINWMALEKDEVQISEALMQLSQFYRMALNRGNA